MSGHGEKLSRKQDQAIAALLSAPTLPDAAKQAGIAEHTLRRWLHTAPFCEAYREARRQVVQLAIVGCQQATSQAVETLLAVMQDGAAPASARVRAAQVVLEFSLRAIELEDFETRLAALEAHVPGKG